MEVLTVPTIVAPRAKGLMKPYLHPILCDPALKAYYTFEKAGATLRDLSGNGNHGTITGATWVGKGRNGMALDFEKDNSDVVNCGVAAACDCTTELMTIAMWLKPETTPAPNSGLVDKSTWMAAGYLLYLNGDGVATFYTFNGGGGDFAEAGTAVVDGVWTHLVVQRHTSSGARFFVNGVESTHVTNNNARNMTAPTGVDLVIGNNDGLIDSAMIFTRALSATEVKNLYEAGL